MSDLPTLHIPMGAMPVAAPAASEPAPAPSAAEHPGMIRVTPRAPERPAPPPQYDISDLPAVGRIVAHPSGYPMIVTAITPQRQLCCTAFPPGRAPEAITIQL